MIIMNYSILNRNKLEKSDIWLYNLMLLSFKKNFMDQISKLNDSKMYHSKKTNNIDDQ